MKLDDMNFGAMGSEITLRQTEVERVSVLKKLSGVYDEFAKLVFMFDCSGSMSERVARSYQNQYVWTDTILNDIRARVAKALADFLSDPTLTMGLDEIKLLDPSTGGMPTFTPNDEELKIRIVQQDLMDYFGIKVDFSKSHATPPRRMDLVKKLAKSELENRFKKFPNSRIAVVPFGSYPATLFDDGKPEDLWPALEKLEINMVVKRPDLGEAEIEMTGGGTDILAAIRRSMDICRAKPSPVGLHHLIIVSDGEDGSSYTIGSWVPSMKASGIVLDYIHIGCESHNTELAAACKALSGEFVSVNSEKDFETKFVEAVNRPLMLTAG